MNSGRRSNISQPIHMPHGSIAVRPVVILIVPRTAARSRALTRWLCDNSIGLLRLAHHVLCRAMIPRLAPVQSVQGKHAIPNNKSMIRDRRPHSPIPAMHRAAVIMRALGLGWTGQP